MWSKQKVKDKNGTNNEKVGKVLNFVINQKIHASVKFFQMFIILRIVIFTTSNSSKFPLKAYLLVITT